MGIFTDIGRASPAIQQGLRTFAQAVQTNRRQALDTKRYNLQMEHENRMIDFQEKQLEFMEKREKRAQDEHDAKFKKQSATSRIAAFAPHHKTRAFFMEKYGNRFDDGTINEHEWGEITGEIAKNPKGWRRVRFENWNETKNNLDWLITHSKDEGEGDIEKIKTIRTQEQRNFPTLDLKKPEDLAQALAHSEQQINLMGEVEEENKQTYWTKGGDRVMGTEEEAAKNDWLDKPPTKDLEVKDKKTDWFNRTTGKWELRTQEEVEKATEGTYTKKPTNEELGKTKQGKTPTQEELERIMGLQDKVQGVLRRLTWLGEHGGLSNTDLILYGDDPKKLKEIKKEKQGEATKEINFLEDRLEILQYMIDYPTPESVRDDATIDYDKKLEILQKVFGMK